MRHDFRGHVIFSDNDLFSRFDSHLAIEYMLHCRMVASFREAIV